jgi:L-amino acid N-acyltransferase YncA
MRRVRTLPIAGGWTRGRAGHERLMTGAPRVRLAMVDDAEAMLAIYAPVVRDSAISFELEPPTLAEMRGRIEAGASSLPWLVCERAGTLLGYAYAGPHRSRPAYRWSVETSVYVSADAQRRGVARALYSSLMAILELQGYRNLFAIITLPNPASVAFHEVLGFAPIGVHRRAGYKLGAWHDVGWWQRWLGEDAPDPSPPSPLSAVRSHPQWESALSAGLSCLRSKLEQS